MTAMLIQTAAEQTAAVVSRLHYQGHSLRPMPDETGQGTGDAPAAPAVHQHTPQGAAVNRAVASETASERVVPPAVVVGNKVVAVVVVAAAVVEVSTVAAAAAEHALVESVEAVDTSAATHAGSQEHSVQALAHFATDAATFGSVELHASLAAEQHRSLRADFAVTAAFVAPVPVLAIAASLA
jgi:hypothetical protein